MNTFRMWSSWEIWKMCLMYPTFFAPFISPTQATLIMYLRVQAQEAKGVAPEVHKVPAEVERSSRGVVHVRNIPQGVG